MKTIIGIDPGSKGFIAVLRPDGGREWLSIADSTRYDIAKFLMRFTYTDCIVTMEEVHAILGSSAKATFAFGEIFGLLKGIVTACALPLELVQPKSWQSEVWVTEDKVYRYNTTGKKMVDTKGTSIRAAQRLFPTVDFRRTPSCKNIDDNKVDATLIAEYARRKNL